MVVAVLRWFVLGVAALPFCYYVLATYCAWRFYRQPRRPANNFTPPVSILKPVRGVDPEAYENFASFCRQDYPEYEILFGVSEAEDPVIPVIQNLMRDFPERPIRLLIGSDTRGTSSKVSKLCRLVREARYDLLVISDSDIRVGPDYLRAVVVPFQDPQVGAVTCPYVGIANHGLGSEIEAIGESSDFYAGVLADWLLEGVKFTLGSTMATTRQRLAEIGGFEALVDHFVDDYELGYRIANRGYRVELSPYAVGTVFPSQTLGDYFSHQVRWLIAARHSRPLGHLGLVFTHGLAWTLLAVAVAPSPYVAVMYSIAYAALRLLMGWMVGVRGLKDHLLRRKWYLVPLRDALAFFIWLVSLFANRIEWRGREFYVRQGRLVPVEAQPSRWGLK